MQSTARGLELPRRIPEHPIILIHPAPSDLASSETGIAGGIGNGNGSGNAVITGLLAAHASEPPPMPVVKRPEPAAAPIRIKRGGEVQKGMLISGPPPVYPVLARQARVSGTVRLEAVISRDGTVMNLHALSGHPLLIPAAMAAVQRWIFKPTYLNGDPVEVATTIDVNFALQ